MGFWSKLFSKEEPVAPIIIEPIMPKQPISEKDEYEMALDKFETELETKAVHLEESRETLYDQKAKLNTKRALLKQIEAEVKEHEAELASVEESHLKAIEEERTELEIRGQKLQNIILRKRGRLTAEQNSLVNLESTIDMLERSILANDVALSQKHTKLDAAKTAVAINKLNDEVNNKLSLCRIEVDEEGLDFFLEKQKVILEENTQESTVIINPDSNVMAIPFKDRVGKGEITDV